MAQNNKPKKPSAKVTDLAITREGYRWTATWKVPAAALKKDKDKNPLPTSFTGLQIQWTLKTEGDKFIDKDKESNEESTSSSQTFGEFDYFGKAASRENFFPVSGFIAKAMAVKVRGFHKSGKTVHYAPWSAQVSYEFKKPRKPSVSFEYNEGTKVVTYTITSDPGTDAHERYNTLYNVLVYRAGYEAAHFRNNEESKNLTITGSVDLDQYGVDWESGTEVMVWVGAYAQGLAGLSDQGVASYSVMWPGKPAITSVTAGVSGRVKIGLATTREKYTTVQLQRAKEIAPGEEPRANDWQNVEGAAQDNDVTALYDLVSDAKSEDGFYTWYRVRADRQGFHDYSNTIRADALFTPVVTAADDKVGIIKIRPGIDEGTADVYVGFNEDIPNTGTEVAWSEYRRALMSTESYSTHQFTWKHDESVSPEWGGSTDITIIGLDENKRTYVWARRYLERNGATTYTPWSNPVMFDSSLQPTIVVLSAPRSVSGDEAIELSWVVDGTAEQTGWAVHPANNPKISYAEGKGAARRASISPEKVKGSAKIEVFVTVFTDEGSYNSNIKAVTIAYPPTIVVCSQTPITEQPVAVEVYAYAGLLLSAKPAPTIDLACRVWDDSSIAAVLPDKPVPQYPRDVLWADQIDIDWSEATTFENTMIVNQFYEMWHEREGKIAAAEAEMGELDPSDPRYKELSELVEMWRNEMQEAQDFINSLALWTNTYIGRFTLPPRVPFIDGATYEFSAVAKDAEVGLPSDVATHKSIVAWNHQAPVPSPEIEVEIDETRRTASIKLVPPEDAAEGDLYDLYRGTADGYLLIRSNLKLNDTVLDHYPSFGEMTYCVLCRTADGDVDWTTYDYSLPVARTRIDWAGEFIEFERNLEFSDTAEKRFEARTHSDGSIGGYYAPGVSKSGTYSAAVIRDIDDTDALAKLAAYSGSCYCRTPDGKAFACNVDVSTNTTRKSPVGQISLSITRVDLTDDFIVHDADITAGA